MGWFLVGVCSRPGPCPGLPVGVDPRAQAETHDWSSPQSTAYVRPWWDMGPRVEGSCLPWAWLGVLCGCGGVWTSEHCHSGLLFVGFTMSDTEVEASWPKEQGTL